MSGAGPIGSPGFTPPSLPMADTAPAAGVATAGRLGDVSVRSVPTAETALAAESLAAPDRAVPHEPVVSARPVAPRAGDLALAREAVPTKEQLIAQLGKPKSDITFLGFTLMRRDTSYKEVLGALDAYHGALGRCGGMEKASGSSLVGLSPEKRGAVEEGLDVMQSLEQLDNAMAGFVSAGKPHSHEMEVRRVQVRAEREMVGKAIDDLAQSSDNHLGFVEVLAFRRVTPELALRDIEGLKAKGYSAEEYGDIMALPKNLATGVLSQKDANKAIELGMRLPEVSAHHKSRVPISEATRPTIDISATPAERMGAGGINTVYRVQGQAADGTAMDGVYKRDIPVQADGSIPRVEGGARPAGIDPMQPNWGVRSVATSRLNDHLGLGVIPVTKLVTRDGEIGSVMGLAPGTSPMVTGTVRLQVEPATAARLAASPDLLREFAMSKGFSGASVDTEKHVIKLENVLMQPSSKDLDERGDPLRKPTDMDGFVAFNYADPVLRRDLTKLQWLDCLTGQVDRHGHNYFVETDPAGTTVLGVKGIDNDMAFGAQVGADRLAGADHRQPMPKVVDRETFDAFHRLTDSDIDHMCAGLTPAEIRATKDRLTAIKAQMAEISKAPVGVIASLEGWRDQRVGIALGSTAPSGGALPSANQRGTYVARDAAHTTPGQQFAAIRPEELAALGRAGA